MSDKIVARVNGKEITQDDVMQFLEEVGPQVAMQFQSEDGMKEIIKEMVSQELLLQDAKDNNLDQEQEFQDVLEKTKDNLLKSYAFQKVLADVEVTEEDAKKLFEEQKENFAKETASAAHILVDSEDKAKEIKEELDGGKDFAEAAKEYSTCPSNAQGGELGQFERGMMVPEFEEVAFDMEEEEISEPIKTEFGYHIIKSGGTTDPKGTKFEDVATEVFQEATRLKQQETYLNKIEELKTKYQTEIL